MPSPAAEYAAQRRADATAAGRPLPRMYGPAVANADRFGSRIVLTGAGGKIIRVGQKVKPATIMEMTAVCDGQSRVWFADRATFRAVQNRLDKQGSANRRCQNARRKYELAATLSGSSQAVILTAALARRWWLPEGRNVRKVKVWREAFGIDDGPDGIVELVELAAPTGDLDMGTAMANARIAAAGNERGALRTVTSASIDAAIDAFRKATRSEEAWDAAVRLDPYARHEKQVTGHVVAFTPYMQDGRTVMADVTSPCRVRRGDVLLLAAATQPDSGSDDPVGDLGLARLVQIGWDDDRGVVAEFRLSVASRLKEGSALHRGRATLEAGVTDSTTLLMTSNPWLDDRARSQPRSRRWTGRTDTFGGRVDDRDVPLDVVLAGGPTDRD